MRVHDNHVCRVAVHPATGSLTFGVLGRPGETYHVSSWESGFALSLHGVPRQGCNAPDVRLFPAERGGLSQHDFEALAAFLQTIPPEIVQLVEPISYAQLQALQLVRHAVADVRDRADELRMFLWLLAASLLTHSLTLPQAVGLFSGKRVEIVKLFLADCTRRHVNIVRKVKPVEFSRSELRTLVMLLKHDEVQHELRHLETFVLPKVAIVLANPAIMKLPVVQRCLSDPGETEFTLSAARTMYETCLRLGDEAGLDNVPHVLKQCKTVEALTMIANRWHDRYNTVLNEQRAGMTREREAAAVLQQKIDAKRERAATAARIRRERSRAMLQRTEQGDFPEPPIPGTKYIVPIRTYEELKKEGQVMNNCVKSYAGRIRRGASYIYKVYFPERCTLEVRCGRICRLGELKGRGNAKPHNRVFYHVYTWLSQQA